MISKITMSGVASYKSTATIETNKKINLIYGLNGAGKTVLSSYLYDPQNLDYSGCNIEGLQGEKILVYNEKFVRDNFYEAENLKGIQTSYISLANSLPSLESLQINVFALDQKVEIELALNTLLRISLNTSLILLKNAT